MSAASHAAHVLLGVQLELERPRAPHSVAPYVAMGGQFPTTRWSVVLGAAHGSEAPRRALHELCAAYWRPLYAFLRRDGMPPEDAEDLVQGF